jgi:hypothetical protein
VIIVAKQPKRHPGLASALLLGTPGGDPRYYNRKFPKPGSKRELAARAALARELLAEAPQGYFVKLIAAMIDPRTDSPFIRQTIKFVRHKGGLRASGRRHLEIATFMRAHREKHPELAVEQAALDAADHFEVSERTIWAAWEAFGGGSGANK